PTIKQRGTIVRGAACIRCHSAAVGPVMAMAAGIDDDLIGNITKSPKRNRAVGEYLVSGERRSDLPCSWADDTDPTVLRSKLDIPRERVGASVHVDRVARMKRIEGEQARQTGDRLRGRLAVIAVVTRSGSKQVADNRGIVDVVARPVRVVVNDRSG